MPDLFDPLAVKNWNLPHRLVMAPLTRNRATRAWSPATSPSSTTPSAPPPA